MRAFTPLTADTRCPDCALRREWCLCADLPRITVGPKVVIIRHFKEVRRPTNSGRLAHLMLADSVLLDHGRKGVSFDPSAVAGDDVWLLFPKATPKPDGSNPTDAAPSTRAPSTPARPPRVLVVLDGTWGQARRMSRRLPSVEALPRLSVPPARPHTQRLRMPHAPWAMATIEAIARAFEGLGHPAAADALDAAFLEFVGRTRRQRGEPTAGWAATRAATASQGDTLNSPPTTAKGHADTE